MDTDGSTIQEQVASPSAETSKTETKPEVQVVEPTQQTVIRKSFK